MLQPVTPPPTITTRARWGSTRSAESGVAGEVSVMAYIPVIDVSARGGRPARRSTVADETDDGDDEPITGMILPNAFGAGSPIAPEPT